MNLLNVENKKQVLTLALAVLLGIVAAVLAAVYVQTKIEQQTKLLAKEYEKKNTGVISELERVKQEIKKVSSDQAALSRKTDQIQQTVRTQPSGIAVSGAPQQPSQISAFSLKTPPGKRAVTIMIDSLSAVGGLVNPGDFIDVIGQLDLSGSGNAKESGSGQKVTTVLFQNVQVLAVGTNFEPIATVTAYDMQQKTRSLNVTLALTPEEVGLLAFAQEHGKLQLSLRSPAEKENQMLQVASWATLSDYLLEHQGTELNVPKSRAMGVVGSKEEVKPYIQIFRSGREL